MAKLKSYGIITPDELHSTEQAGRFVITNKLTCAYCPEPVTVKDHEYLYCQQHHYLKMSVEAYPGYPAIPKEVPRYHEMHFSLSRLDQNRGTFDNETSKDIAREKGCPFCGRYMDPPPADKRDFSVLNQRFFCPDCGVAFQIVVSAYVIGDQNLLALRFQPSEKHLQTEAAVEHTDVGNRQHPQIEQQIEHPPVEQQVEHPPMELETGEHSQIEQAEIEQKMVEQTEIEQEIDDALAIEFIETQLIAEVEHFLPTSEIYHRYEKFAHSRKHKPLKDKQLYKHIRERFNVEKTRWRIDGKLRYGFIGIRWQ